MAAEVSTSRQQSGTSVDRTWFGQRPKRTEAMPKNTLFGGELEIYKDDDKEKISKIDIEQFQKDIEKQRRAKQTRYHPKLPAYLRKKGEPDITLEENKETVSNQLREHAQAKKLLDVLETNSKFFNVGVKNSYERTPSELGKPHQWFKTSDLKHSDDINKLGLEASKTGNYNRDRYETKPETHQYSLHGDPLRKGMDFAIDTRSPLTRATASYSRARDPSWLPREAYMKKKSDQDESLFPHLPHDLPPNIQHAFGTKICTQVLSDPVKVQDTVKEQEMIKANFYKTRMGDGKKFVLPSERTDPVYQDLSHSVRQNMFPGYTFNHTKSLNKEVYTDDVFKNRQQDPDQWRYHRDELSTWAEYNVLRDRQSKEWDKYNSNKPKLEANWDRTAKRPEPPPKPVEKPKQKVVVNKPKKKPAAAKDGGFEDVVFKTPPVTPPPAPPSPPKVMPKEEFKKDDKFWEFYNKGK